jgi:hypothetical protein
MWSICFRGCLIEVIDGLMVEERFEWKIRDDVDDTRYLT